MVFGFGLALGQEIVDEDVKDIPVFCVDHHQGPGLFAFQEHLVERAVVDHEGALVC